MRKLAGWITSTTAVASTPGGNALTVGRSRYLRPWGVPALLVGASLACLAVLALATLTGPPTPSFRVLRSRHSTLGHPATRLPVSLAATASASIGASENGFWPVRNGHSLLTQGGGIHGTFSSAGAALRVDTGTLGLSLAAVGRGRPIERVATVEPRLEASQILYSHGSISEFYRNGPYGLEQGFSLRQRPRAGAGPLVLALGLRGSLSPKQAGSQILFRAHSGAAALRYGQLSALDAAGRRLPAHMQLVNGTVQLRIDDSGARYPIRIDPFIQQGGKLTGSGEVGKGIFGTSVALSGDGKTALIGAENDKEDVGAAWVFTRSGSTWTQQGSKLTGSGEVGKGFFGASVALSNEGSTALIGGESDNTNKGAAWVFTRSESGAWTQQGEKLTGGGEKGEGEFGIGVALSSDGNTALIGGYGDNKRAGAAWVFTRASEKWTQSTELTGSGATGTEVEFGVSVALSGEGKTALIGGRGDNANIGAAWVFTGSGSTWTQQEKLTGSGETGPGRFGETVALSREGGNTALIGGLADNAEIGAAWVFTRASEKWTQQGAKLTGGGETGPGQFGSGVALSGDGNTALIGGQADNGGIGAAWVFTRASEKWTQQGEKLTASSGESGSGKFGSSVSLSTDKNTALIGGQADNGEIGAAWVFTNPPIVVTGTASSVTHTSATLNATVNPNGGEVSECKFEYGTNTEYKSVPVSCVTSPGSGESPVAVSAAVTGLSENTTYHFRISATNASGTSLGSDQTFGAPTVETKPPSSVTQTSATLNATVNPNGGEVSECKFEYGTNTEYKSVPVSCVPSPGSGSSPVAVSASVAGLTAKTPYHFRISATNSGGTSKGSDQEFKTLPNAPTVVTGMASSITKTSATLNATVNPNGGEVTECKLEYGPTTAYGSSAPCTPPPGSLETPVAVSASVSGLTANTPYHFRIFAKNAGGPSSGSDQEFKTLPNAPTFEPCAGLSIAQTTATLCDKVNPNGGAVSECKFEYGTTTSYGSSIACSPLPGSGETMEPVFAFIEGLKPNTIYHFRISATNPGGTSKGSDQEFKTLPNPPTVEAKAASSITRSSATLNATVNPNGGEVEECNLEYGLTNGYGSSKPCTPSPGSVETLVAVSASITGLSPNTTYHFRISAKNAGGTRRSEPDQTFSTLLPNPPTFATSFAAPTNLEGSFKEPDAVALDPSGNIWVADSGHNRVLEFNKERKFLRQFGSEGSGQGQFMGIGGIAANSSGDVYVSGSDRVQEFSPTGEFLRQFGSPGSGIGQFHGPSGIAVDSSGNVWVLDTFNYRVQEFSATGEHLGQFGEKGTGNGQLGWASGLAFSGGNLYVADSARVQEFSTAGTFIATFGSSGSGNGQFHGLGGIATDPTTGNLYVSDTFNNRVQEFSAAGAFIAAFGSGGSGAGQFSAPRGVAVNASGTLYVADAGNNRVQEWLAAKVAGEPPTFATSFTPEKIEGGLSEPDAVALDASGNIWVADSGHNRVLEFNSKREYLRKFGSEGSGQGQFMGIAGIAANSSGDVYVSGSDRVQEFSPTGEYLRQWGSPGSGEGQFHGPSGIAVDGSGNVWVLDTFNYRVQEFSESGEHLRQFGEKGTGNGQLGWASGLAFAGGNLYVADGSRVQEFSTVGTYLSQFGSSGTGNGQFHGLGGIASDPTTGNLYVSDVFNNRVQEFSSSGAFIGFIAAFGSGGSGAGQFSGPRGVAVGSSGTLYVADSGNNRVQEWVPSP